MNTSFNNDVRFDEDIRDRTLAMQDARPSLVDLEHAYGHLVASFDRLKTAFTQSSATDFARQLEELAYICQWIAEDVLASLPPREPNIHELRALKLSHILKEVFKLIQKGDNGPVIQQGGTPSKVVVFEPHLQEAIQKNLERFGE
jgi:hypothetical protein